MKPPDHRNQLGHQDLTRVFARPPASKRPVNGTRQPTILELSGMDAHRKAVNAASGPGKRPR